MDAILDLEGTAIFSTAGTFSLTSINVRHGFFPSGRNTNNMHLEGFDTSLGSEPDITGHLPTSNTTTPEIGGWTTDESHPTTLELTDWRTVKANSTSSFDNWSPLSTDIDLSPGNIYISDNADTEERYQDISPTSIQQETSYSKIHSVRVIKHKLSAITFTDIPLDVISESASCDNDAQEDKESGDDTEEDDESDDVFTDLPRYKYTFTGIKRRSSHPRSPNHKIFIDSKEIFHPFHEKYRNNGTDLGEEERKTSMEEKSKWSLSMACVMMKLEQLNVDIEGAISASSHPLCIPQKNSEEQVHGDTLVYKVAELEAKEACEWLRAAGFPQYAQLYEDSQFPIDIASVKRDHDFLDRDHVEPLCRRLNTLNKCASMKLDVSLQRKKSEDSDEEDLCAISDKWTFQRFSRRWSRVDDIDTLLGRSERLGSSGDMKNTTSSESVLTDLSEPEICSIHSGSSGGSDCRCASSDTFECNDTMCVPDSNSYWPRDISDGKLNVKTDKSSHTKAKTLLKCMGTLRGKGAHGKLKGPPKTVGLIISEPILKLEPESVKSMNCVQIGNGPVNDSIMDLKVTGNLDSNSETRTIDESTSSLKDAELSESNKRAGMYLEDIDLFTMTGIRAKPSQNHKNESHSQEDLVVYIPKDHKPGTFPKAISIESLSPSENLGGVNWRGASISHSGQMGLCVKEPRPLSSRCPRGSRLSVYDNVPGSHLYASTGDLMDLEKDDLFPHLDDVLQHINGLQQSVDHWSKDIMPELQDDNVSLFQIPTPVFRTPNPVGGDFEGNSISDGRTTPSDLERDAASLNESDATGTRERRDSGVGASLTRTNRHLRWHSFQVSHQLSRSLASLQISNQSASQLNLLQKFSLLRLTAIMEKYSMSNKHGWTWSVPKFMKRMKGPDYKDKNVFGVPLMVHVQRTGQPLPQSIQQALRFLRSNCLDQVGLFRKSGVKSRIQALRQMNESSPENVNYEGQCAYDVADMMKQFFRDLPEPLLTSKLGETFLHIYQYVPKDQRLQAVQSAIMLMSDENREVLQTLLCFLGDVSLVEENQMTPMNLAVCLAPSLFHLNLLKKDNSPRAIQKKYATGKPDQKDLNENLAATQGLAHMIMECNKLFEIPEEIIAQSRNSYAEADIHVPTLEELVKQMDEEAGSVCTYFDTVIQNLQKESKDKFKGWLSFSSTENTDLAYKKVGDGNPLRLWKASVEVEAPPSVVLNRLLRERHLWDDDFAQAKIIETIDSQTEVYQYVVDSMPPHPSKDFVVLRTWRTDLAKGMCSLVATSVEHEDAPLIGGVRATVMDTRYLIEPCGSGKSRLTYICRVDLKGHCLDWYNKCFGHLCAVEALRIRNSFQPLTAEGPETKI